VAVGGRGTLAGAILGAVLVNLGKTWLTSALPEIWLFAMGGLFILVTVFLPHGILGLFAARRSSTAPERESAAAESAAAETVAREVTG
jgi:urea transport system permease protein